MSELIKHYLKLDKNQYIYVRVGEDTFTTLTHAKSHYTILINTRLQYLQPLMKENLLAKF